MPIEREPYQRVRCTRCGDSPPPFHRFEVVERDATPRYPVGMLIHRSRTNPCGPVVVETVGIQEQFIEWCYPGLTRC